MPQRPAVTVLAAALVLLAGGHALGDREPVLDQIEVPHDYYFREMYLPRVTTGPAAPAWMPDGEALVYAMQGSLWLQAVNATVARQLTAGSGYDYQPDVSPDGRRVVFARYDGTAIELAVLELDSGAVEMLTDEGAVNTDPRWSPDGSRIAFVSTRDTGRFKVYVGAWEDDGFVATQLVADRKSSTPRYYYSVYDHELSPAWTPDGEHLLVVANPETPYGTGDLWLYPVAGGGEPVLVRREETSWKAQPDVAPDGRRIAYASYLGRQWHQLWVHRIGTNAEPFPLTYGVFDVWDPRWSPDGERIAYAVNEGGNTSLRIQDFVGGRQTDLVIAEREYLEPHGTLALTVTDDRGRPTPARVSVVAADGRAHAPADAWLHADDGFDRDTDRTEFHYFHTQGEAGLTLPAGPARITVWRGPESQVAEVDISISATEANALTVVTRRLDLPEGWSGNWLSGDVHVHMNYGGTYRNTPANLVRQARAEDLDVVFNLVVNKEQRVPDVAWFNPAPDAASTPGVVLVHAQEYHTSFWGHQGLLGLDSHLLIPDYAAYPGTAAASIYPDNTTVARLAREQGALVGYVHPFLAPPPDPQHDARLTHAFPVDAALGLVDYYEVVGFADPRASAEVWYGLMNCGLRIAAAGGTDAMANYASLRGPLGQNRTYVQVGERADSPASRADAWLAGLAADRSFATNGPLLGFTVRDQGPGGELPLPAGRHALEYQGFVRSAVPVDHVEVVLNGEVVAAFDAADDGRRADLAGRVEVDRSGWLLLRAWRETSHRLTFDSYPYATTTPVWITVGGEPPRSDAAAGYFTAWVDRLIAAAGEHPDYNSAAERERVLANLGAARERFAECRAPN